MHSGCESGLVGDVAQTPEAVAQTSDITSSPSTLQQFGPLSSPPDAYFASTLAPAWPRAHEPRPSPGVRPARISPTIIVLLVPSVICFNERDMFGPITPIRHLGL